MWGPFFLPTAFSNLFEVTDYWIFSALVSSNVCWDEEVLPLLDNNLVLFLHWQGAKALHIGMTINWLSALARQSQVSSRPKDVQGLTVSWLLTPVWDSPGSSSFWVVRTDNWLSAPVQTVTILRSGTVWVGANNQLIVKTLPLVALARLPGMGDGSHWEFLISCALQSARAIWRQGSKCPAGESL